MGFFRGLGRLVAGKPVFEAPDGAPKPNEPMNEQAAPNIHRFVDEHGYKIIPTIELTHFKTRLDDQTMTTTAWVTNSSKERVRIDHVTILGKKQVVMRELAPSQGYEIELYEGPVAHHEHDSDAELVFRLLERDDMFMVAYFVEFNREANGEFLIEELHPEDPTRDI